MTRYGLDDLDRAIADGAAHGFVKILTEPGKDRILGVTIVGEHGGDLMAEFVLAIKHGHGSKNIIRGDKVGLSLTKGILDNMKRKMDKKKMRSHSTLNADKL